jgi:vacuolar-type H+-ATPase subunit F/Vma7
MAFHIIGDQDTVLGYRFAGVTGEAVESIEEARDAFRRALADAGNRILMLTESVEAMLETEATAHRLSSKPPYLVVVGDIAATQIKRKSLEAMIHEAVGIRIVSDTGES